jgi:hypothetical protein
MGNLATFSTVVWLGIAAAVVIVLVLLYKFIESKLGSSGTSEANPNVDEQAAQDALVKMSSPEATQEEQADALKTFFNTAHDPNPQGFFERLWSMF